MSKRTTREENYMTIAQVVSLRATCGRLAVGCVIVKDKRIVATGYNGPLKVNPEGFHTVCGCDTSTPCTKAIHAEANAIAFCAKHGIPLDDTKIYCTHSPCIKCAELIIQAGIKKVVYYKEFRDNAGLLLLRQNGVETLLYGGREIQEITELINSVQEENNPSKSNRNSSSTR